MSSTLLAAHYNAARPTR